MGRLSDRRRPDEPIVGGEAALGCQWPAVVDMSTCSGVLVHPEIVVYAGHCGPQGEVTFGNGDEGFTVSIDPSDCELHPTWTLAGNDVAYCMLPVAVVDVPLVYMLGAPEQLPAPGDLVTLVGYGQTEDGPTGGVKHFGQAPFVGFDEGELLIGGNGTDTCTGDSGGPAMVEQPDGTWRVIGLTSRADGDVLCGGVSRYTFAPPAADWVEQAAGIDITPCFDGQVPMMCAPSDADPDDPFPEWCDWTAEEGTDVTGESGAGEGSTGDSGGSETSTGDDIMHGDGEAVPDRGCSCAAQPGTPWLPVVLALVYLVARMLSSYARP